MKKIAASGSLHGRAVKEWIGRTPDSVPPKSVQDRVLLRQGGKDAITGEPILAGMADCDHIIRLKDGGENRESNLQIITRQSHREKTRLENQAGAKERRIRLKHAGLWPKSKRPIKSRGFEKRMNGTVERWT
ncbi:HNH endonuclease signature motif containing protein [Aestuariivirga sp.]|uniref:HNH endonuclease signature motif containing protein n=1 Tax=Aestuariivirga sp. TaxID=2650926 RepID=UPI0039E2B082